MEDGLVGVGLTAFYPRPSVPLASHGWKVHVNYHGCSPRSWNDRLIWIRNINLNEYGEANGIIIVYPQAAMGNHCCLVLRVGEVCLIVASALAQPLGALRVSRARFCMSFHSEFQS